MAPETFPSQSVGGFPISPRGCEVHLESVPRFLVESYVAVSPEAFDGACQRARRIAKKTPDLRYIDTTYLPGDEIVTHLFDAPSVEVPGGPCRASRHDVGLLT